LADGWERIAEAMTGRRVRLEPRSPTHEDGLRRAAADNRIWRWMPVDAHADLGRWLAHARAQAEAGLDVPFATIDTHSGEPIGSTRYLALRPEHRSLEIGATWVAPSAWGTGANVEAKPLMLERAFAELGCRRVEFKTDALNERARGALEALCARFEGIHRKHMLVRGGERRDSAWYSILDEEWPAVQAHVCCAVCAQNG
jgi:RimJ/RimL family protein N-acetyltransferase